MGWLEPFPTAHRWSRPCPQTNSAIALGLSPLPIPYLRVREYIFAPTHLAQTTHSMYTLISAFLGTILPYRLNLFGSALTYICSIPSVSVELN